MPKHVCDQIDCGVSLSHSNLWYGSDEVSELNNNIYSFAWERKELEEHEKTKETRLKKLKNNTSRVYWMYLVVSNIFFLNSIWLKYI